MAWIVGKASDIAPGKAVPFEVDGRQVAVASVDGKLYAFSDICTHMGCSLSDGALNGNVIICPCHGSQFDVTTGDIVRPPAWMPLETYTVDVVGDQLKLEKIVVEEEAPEEVQAGEAPKAEAPVQAPAAAAAKPHRDAAAEDALSHVALFQGLGRETLESLEAFTFRRKFKSGDLIVEEGRTGNGLFVVLSGKVEVVKGTPVGRPQVVATLGPGEPFGEMALIGEWPRTASVKALEETECLGMDRWVFMAHIRRDPELGIRMLQVLAERLARTDARFVE